MGHLLDNSGMAVIWSVPLYFALTSRPKGRAKGIALWAYLWLIAGVLGVNMWRLAAIHQEQLAQSPPGYAPLAQIEVQYRLILWGGSLLSLIGLVLPVALYRQDLRKPQGA